MSQIKKETAQNSSLSSPLSGSSSSSVSSSSSSSSSTGSSGSSSDEENEKIVSEKQQQQQQQSTNSHENYCYQEINDNLEEDEEKSAVIAAAAAKSSISSSSSKKQNSTRRISARSTLESIQESESPQDSKMASKSNSFAKCFGVKSYLHEFYDQNSTLKHAKKNGSESNKKRTLNKILYIIWKVTLWFGIVLLLIGITLLILGYSMREKTDLITASKSMEIVDKEAIKSNSRIEYCRLIGLVLVSCGGFILALSLLLPTFICYKQCLFRDSIFDSEENYNNSSESYAQMDQIKSPINKNSFIHVQPQSQNSNLNAFAFKAKNYETMDAMPVDLKIKDKSFDNN